MTMQEDEIGRLSGDIKPLAGDQRDAAVGGAKWIDAHMPYNDFNRMPVSQAAPISA
jgi:hypothetical protein